MATIKFMYYMVRGQVYASVKKPTIIDTIRLDYIGLDMYREWKKIEFPKEYCI
jgi:hypothetical protein